MHAACLTADSCLLQFPVLVLLLSRIEIAAFMLRCTAISLLTRPGE